MIAKRTNRGLAADNKEIIMTTVKLLRRSKRISAKKQKKIYIKIKNSANNDNNNHGSELIDTDNNKTVPKERCLDYYDKRRALWIQSYNEMKNAVLREREITRKLDEFLINVEKFSKTVVKYVKT